MDALGAYDSDSSDDDQEVATKDAPSHSSNNDNVGLMLPRPPTSHEKASMIYWPTDYLTTKQQNLIKMSSTKKTVSPSKARAKNLAVESSVMAEDLQKQHDFQNPHLFKALQEQLGIVEKPPYEWESIQQLMVKEEEVRIRQQRGNP